MFVSLPQSGDDDDLEVPLATATNGEEREFNHWVIKEVSIQRLKLAEVNVEIEAEKVEKEE